MTRSYVPFDDSYRVPADIHVSRGVRCGDLVFTCGQLDMDGESRPQNIGDIQAQTERSMALLYDVLDQAGAAPEDMAHLHVFYRHDGRFDEDAYVDKFASLLPGDLRPVTVFTPVASFPAQGLEVEIDTIAVTDAANRRREATDDSGTLCGVKCGEVIFAAASPPREPSGGVRHPGDIGRQTDAVMAQLAGTLATLGADLSDVCKLTLYTSTDIETGSIGECERICGDAFPNPGPVYTNVLLPRFAHPGETVRLEVVAMRGERDERLPRQNLSQADHWAWPGGLPYSQALSCGNLVFVGGQLSLDRDGSLVHAGDLAAQTDTTMTHVQSALGACGARLDQMTKVNAYFKAAWDPDGWQVNVNIRSSYYGPPGPASTGIEVPALIPERALIAVDCIAVTS